MANWKFTETLKRCHPYLINEYTVKVEVEELASDLYSQGHISYTQRQDIQETVRTTDRMRHILDVLIRQSDGNVKESYKCLVDKFTQSGRTDIVSKLQDTMDIVKRLSQPPEEDVPEMAKRIHSDMQSVTFSELHRCLGKMVEYMTSRKTSEAGCQGRTNSVKHHQASTTDDDPYTRLVEACNQDDAETVVQILAKSTDSVNSTNTDGDTVLMVACRSSNENVVDALLKCDKVDVNRKNHKTGQTALMICVLRGDVDVLSVMLGCERIDVSVCDNDGLTFLWYVFGEKIVRHLSVLAVLVKHFVYILQKRRFIEVNFLRYLSKIKELQGDIDWVKTRNIINCILLHDIVNYTDILKCSLTIGNSDVVSQVLDKRGGNVLDDKDITNYCCVIVTAINCGIIPLLVDKGWVNLKELDTIQVEAVMESVIFHNCSNLSALFSKLVRDLKVSKALKTAMLITSINSDVLDIILHGYKLDLNVHDRNGNSAFLLLCKFGKVSTVRELLRRKDIDVSVRNDYGQTCVMLSLINHDKNVAKILMDDGRVKGLSIMARDMDGTPTFTYACHSGEIGIVKTVMSHRDVDINAIDRMGMTAIMWVSLAENALILCLTDALAKELGDGYIVEAERINSVMDTGQSYLGIARMLLHNSDIDVTKVGQLGSTLACACKGGNEEIVQAIIQSKVDLEAVDESGSTALTDACLFDKGKIAEILVKAGANVNAVSEGWTPLLYASARGNHKVARMLLKAGADVNVVKNDGWMPLLFACEKSDSQMVKVLLEAGAVVNHTNSIVWSPLMLACKHNTAETVGVLIDAGAVVNIKDSLGWSPLTIASEGDNNDMVELLVQAGADVNSTTTDGWTPLMQACVHGNIDIVRRLMETGASHDSVHISGCTALIYACSFSHTNKDIVHLLLQAGADVNIGDLEGKTPLLWACGKSSTDIVSLLLKSGANVNAQYGEGWTPLMTACITNSDTVELLLKAGADIDMKDMAGDTALMTASFHGKVECVDVLLQHNADVSLVNGEGKSAVDFAKDKGFSEIGDILERHGGVSHTSNVTKTSEKSEVKQITPKKSGKFFRFFRPKPLTNAILNLPENL